MMASSKRVWFTRAESFRRGFFCLDRDRTAAAHCGHALVKPGAPPAVPLLAARANVPARGAGPVLAPLRSPGTEIGFAPETIALRLAICRAFSFCGDVMTAYLISLALAGLIAIVLWETFS